MTIGSGWEHEIDERTLAWLDQNAHRIYEVRGRCARDATGVDYEVTVKWDDGKHRTLIEDTDDERGIWSRRVDFGPDAAHRAGGPCFVAAALDMDDCAETMWRRKTDAVPR